MPNFRTFRTVLLAIVLAGMTAGCSLLLDFDECSADGDCVGLSGSDSLICHPDGYCVAGEPAPAGCETDADCTEGAATICGAEQVCVEPAASCVNSECAAVGPNMVCGTNNMCVNALSPECTRTEGPIDQDNIFLVGSIQAAHASSGASQENAVVMAIREFNEAAPFSPSPVRAVLIACNDTGDKDVAVGIANHLVDDLGIAGIVGPGFSSVTIEVVTQVTKPKGVFTISGSATSAAITDLEDDGLAWRAAASDAAQSIALAQRVIDLRDELALGRDLRVLGFAKNDVYGKGLSESVASILLGESGIDFKAVNHEPDVAGDAVATGLGLTPDPDIVLLLTTAEGAEIVRLIEGEGTVEPLYVSSDGPKGEELQAVVDTAGDALRMRVEGTAPSNQNDAEGVFGQFEFRYLSNYSEAPTSYAANAYDATTLLLYARIAADASGAEWAGPNIAEIFQTRFTDQEGAQIFGRPDDIISGRDELLVGNNINYEGASGPLDFDPDTGEAAANVDRWIIAPSGDFENCGLFQAGAWDAAALTRCTE